jgi:hypothetical protein
VSRQTPVVALALVALAWFLLAAANLVKGHVGVGVVYVGIGVTATLAARLLGRGRRAR